MQTTPSDTITHTVHFYGLFNLNVALGPNQSKFVRRPGLWIRPPRNWTSSFAFLRQTSGTIQRVGSALISLPWKSPGNEKHYLSLESRPQTR